MTKQKHYEPFEHTADVGLRVWGSDLEELFRNSVEAMFSLVVDVNTTEPKETLEIKVEGRDLQTLFFNWLDELLYLHLTKYFLFCEVEKIEMSPNHLQASVRGETIDLERHQLLTELKAVTYHQFEVQQTKEGWQAIVIFDV
ncbi:MAG: archease [Deltaproteobacteria bacterium]|nr:archease [Deltaproteobacteria bacterium]